MATRTARSLSIDESLLLLELRERGLKAKPKDVVEALEQLECTYDAEKQRFYLPREFQTVRDGQPLVTTSPDPTDLVAADKEFVLNLVCSYLLGSSYEENGAVVDGARFLPDPSEPTTDLKELAKEQERVKEQKEERMRRRMFIYNNISVREDAAVAKRELSGYMFLLEQHMPDLALPGKEDASERQAHIERFFTEAVAVRGQTVLEKYVEDLEIVASAGVAEVTAAFVQSAPTLYHKLSVAVAREFVADGLEELQRYNNIPLPSVLGKIVGYFSLQSDEAKQTMTDLIEREHEALVPLYGQLKRELKEAEQKVESLRKGLEEKIREKSDLQLAAQQSRAQLSHDLADAKARYDQLERNYASDSAALEQEREKTVRLEDSVQGLTLGYQTAANSRDAVRKLLEENKKEFAAYKSEAAVKLEKSRVTAFVGGALAVGFLAVATYVSFMRVPDSTSTPPKPVPAVTTPATPALASGYNPQGRNLKQLEKDFYTFINQPQAAGKELNNLGPGCLKILGQVYDKMQGTPEGKDYFLNSMTVSDFCDKIPANSLVNLSSGGKK